jgi:hypothetical protein
MNILKVWIVALMFIASAFATITTNFTPDPNNPAIDPIILVLSHQTEDASMENAKLLASILRTPTGLNLELYYVNHQHILLETKTDELKYAYLRQKIVDRFQRPGEFIDNARTVSSLSVNFVRHATASTWKVSYPVINWTAQMKFCFFYSPDVPNASESCVENDPTADQLFSTEEMEKLLSTLFSKQFINFFADMAEVSAAKDQTIQVLQHPLCLEKEGDQKVSDFCSKVLIDGAKLLSYFSYFFDVPQVVEYLYQEPTLDFATAFLSQLTLKCSLDNLPLATSSEEPNKLACVLTIPLSSPETDTDNNNDTKLFLHVVFPRKVKVESN